MNNNVFAAQNRGHDTTPTTYTLDISMTGNGDTEPEPNVTHTYDAGRVVSIEALEDSGWHFYEWTGDATGTDNPITVAMNADKSITAVFTQNDTYTLTTAVTGHGSIRPNSGTYEDGTVVHITAVADDSNHEFDHWTGDLSGDTNPTTITMTADKSITAVFVERKYTLTMASIGGGYTSPATGGHDYVYGTAVSMEAFPNTNYILWNWTGATTSKENPYAIKVYNDLSYTANFHDVREYGYLYNGWVVVENDWNLINGLRIPTIEQWGTLYTHIGGASVAGGKLKEAGTSHWAAGTCGTDNYNVGMIPGGIRGGYGAYADIRLAGNYWTSTFTSNNVITKVELNDASCALTVSDSSYVQVGMSVRLIRNLTQAEQDNNAEGAVVETVSDYNGNVYNLIRIGQFGFLGSNLKCTKYKSGVTIPYISSDSTWSTTQSGAICYYGDN